MDEASRVLLTDPYAARPNGYFTLMFLHLTVEIAPESSVASAPEGSWGDGVRVWQVMSWGPASGAGRPPPDGVDVDYPPYALVG